MAVLISTGATPGGDGKGNGHEGQALKGHDRALIKKRGRLGSVQCVLLIRSVVDAVGPGSYSGIPCHSNLFASMAF